MDFERALRLVGDFLDERGEPWALIGGLGIAALGFPRTTVDLTFARHGLSERFDDLRRP